MSKSLSVLAFLKRQKKDANGLVPLYVRVTIDGDVGEFSLSRKIHSEEWSQEKQRCITKSAEALAINTKVAKIRGELIALFDRQPAHEMIKAQQLIKLYRGQDPGSTFLSKRDSNFHKAVLEIIDRYFSLKIRERKASALPYRFLEADNFQQETVSLIQSIEELQAKANAWTDDPSVDKTLMDAVYSFLLKFLFRVIKGTVSHETFRKWISTKNTIASFTKRRYKASDQPLKSIPLKFAADFYDYLTLTQSVGNNAAMKYIKNAKQVLDEVVVTGWLDKNPWESYKCSYVDPERQALTLQEIARLIDHPFTNSRLSEVRDVFVFCCFTGFAYQEVYGLRPKDLKVGIDGKEWINTTRNKTKNPEFLPLLPIPYDIIKKYGSHPYCVKYKKLLPVNSNQRFNAYLKEIGLLCGIDPELTTHTARHTFATTIAIEHDIPLKIVSVMLGHRTQRTTEIYARASKQAISRHMTALQEKLFGDGRALQVDKKTYTLPTPQPEQDKTKKAHLATEGPPSQKTG